MKKAAFIALFILSAFFNKAQQNFSGKITDSTRTGLEFVTVAILNPTDSSLAQSNLTDVSGVYSFTNIPIGNYILKSFVIGYEEKFSKINVNENTTQLPAVILKTKGVNLGEVSITAIKKNIEFKNGNVIVNIENSALATGNSVYELLFKLPGVTVDENDNILIQGRSGVRVMIDDRIQQMSAKQLINLLQSLNAANIEKIEILKNPPVNYDAAGTGGIINIRTKKVKVTGTSGSLIYNYSQGFYPINDLGFTLNHKAKKVTIYSSVNFYQEKIHHDHRFDKKIVSDKNTSEMHQRMDNDEGGDFVFAEAGADWYINKKNTIGFKFDGNWGNEFESSDGHTTLSDSGLGYNYLKFKSYQPNPWHYLNYNLNAEHLFDTLGSKLFFSTDYAPNYDIYYNDVNNYFMNNAGTDVMPPYIFSQTNTITCNVLTSKLDYKKVFKNELSVLVGAKGSDLKMASDYVFKNRNDTTGEYVVDTMYTNDFSYSEQLTAGYVDVEKSIGKFDLQGGLRGENTAIVAGNKAGNTNYTRNYFNLFPVASIGFNISEENTLTLGYNRRINRPNYNSFNPNHTKSSIFMGDQGNPNILPEYANTIELSHTYKGILSNAISYTNVDNFQLDLTRQNDSTRETYSYEQNIDNSFNIGYSLFFQNDITKWWQVNFNGNAYYAEYKGVINGLNYFSTGYFYMGNLTTTFLIKKKTRLELNGKYIGPRYNGVWYNFPRWSVSVALKRSFLKEKLNVVIGLDDIFFTMLGNNQIKLQGQDWKIVATNDSRRFKLSLTYNFGRTKIEARDVNSNEEEKGRLGR